MVFNNSLARFVSFSLHPSFVPKLLDCQTHLLILKIAKMQSRREICFSNFLYGLAFIYFFRFCTNTFGSHFYDRCQKGILKLFFSSFE